MREHRDLKGLIFVLAAVVPVSLGDSAPVFAEAGSGRARSSARGSLRSEGNQDVRVVFRDECLRVSAFGTVTRNAPPAPPMTGGILRLPAEVEPDSVRWAGLYWEILGEAIPDLAPSMNGVEVVPIFIGGTASPCWPDISYAMAFYADVTGLVRAGENVISGLADSGAPPEFGIESEGCSLVLIYGDGLSGACEIAVMDGNNLIDSNQLGVEEELLISHMCTGEGESAVIFIGGDGQEGGRDEQRLNGIPLGDGDDFDCSDPLTPGAYRGGWDTDRHVVLMEGENVASVVRPAGFGDCVSWLVTIVEAGVHTCGEPTAVRSGPWGRLKKSYR
jgi:hypothetical protein